MTSSRVIVACDHLVKYATGLAGGLAERGAAVTLLTRDHDRDFGGKSGELQRYVGRALDGRATHLQLGGRVRDLRARPGLRTVRHAVAAFSPNVIHLQDSVATDPRLVVAARARPGRFALTVHDPAPHPGAPPAPILERKVRRALTKRAGLIFTHGEALREELIALEAPTCPVVVVPVGPLGGAPAMEGSAPGNSLLFFGRITEYKGLDVLLDAMPAVWHAAPQTRLTVAGSGALPDHQVLGDPRVLVRLGHIPEAEVPELFHAASCVVLPYRQASQSGVAALAGQYGRALVTSRVGALPEIVTPDRGRLVDPDRPSLLSDALIEVVSTPGLAESMGRAAAAASSQTDWGEIAQRTLDAYVDHLVRPGDGR